MTSELFSSLTAVLEVLCEDEALKPTPGKDPLSPPTPMRCSRCSRWVKPRAVDSLPPPQGLLVSCMGENLSNKFIEHFDSQGLPKGQLVTAALVREQAVSITAIP